MRHLRTTWTRNADGWHRGSWLVRLQFADEVATGLWEACKRGADGNLRVLDEGHSARGMMDHADLSDGL